MSSEYHNDSIRPVSLQEETKTVIEEARMVLPGIQAFFGFQLIAVFNNRFQDLTHMEQLLHFIALLMLAVSIALIMTPVAYHRIAERGMVSRHFVELASRFLECALFPLMLSIAVDLFLLARLILGNPLLCAGLALVTLLMFFGLWYIFHCHPIGSQNGPRDAEMKRVCGRSSAKWV